MKHHYAEWVTGNAGLGGFAKLAIEPTDMHTTCTRCGLHVKYPVGAAMRFWVGGKWVAKRPKCTGPAPGSV